MLDTLATRSVRWLVELSDRLAALKPIAEALESPQGQMLHMTDVTRLNVMLLDILNPSITKNELENKDSITMARVLYSNILQRDKVLKEYYTKLKEVSDGQS